MLPTVDSLDTQAANDTVVSLVPTNDFGTSHDPDADVVTHFHDRENKSNSTCHYLPWGCPLMQDVFYLLLQKFRVPAVPIYCCKSFFEKHIFLEKLLVWRSAIIMKLLMWQASQLQNLRFFCTNNKTDTLTTFQSWASQRSEKIIIQRWHCLPLKVFHVHQNLKMMWSSCPLLRALRFISYFSKSILSFTSAVLGIGKITTFVFLGKGCNYAQCVDLKTQYLLVTFARIHGEGFFAYAMS